MKMPVINMVDTCNKIKSACQEKGYTAKDLQKLFGFDSPQACYKWLQGKSLPSIDNLIILSRWLGIGLEELIVTDDMEL